MAHRITALLKTGAALALAATTLSACDDGSSSAAQSVHAVGSSTVYPFAKLVAYLGGEEITIDGFKGNRLYFRDWDRQLRQPLLIATHNAVIERAPIQGFLHQTNNMDTLGFDRRDSQCKP
mgnify:CR=1 FL=1